MRKKSGTLFTFQLALVDTLMLIFLPFHLHEKKSFKWVFGSFLCKVTSSGKFFQTQKFYCHFRGVKNVGKTLFSFGVGQGHWSQQIL